MTRKKAVVITLAILIVGFLFSKFLSSRKKVQEKKNTKTHTADINFIPVQNGNVNMLIETGGIIHAYDKIEIFGEVSGILQNGARPFKAGNRFKKGEVLLKIDDSVFLNNVLAQKSTLMNQITLLIPDLEMDYPESVKNWKKYLDNFTLGKPLLPLPEPVNNKEKYFIASRNIYNLYYITKSMEATLAKYTLKAPFDGVLTEALVNRGTLVRAGQKVGEFTAPHLYELAVPVNVKEVSLLKIGEDVLLTSQAFKNEFTGKISRINQKIDNGTQSVMVYITVKNSRLKDGMYLNAKLQGEIIPNALSVSRKLIRQNNKVFIKEGSVLKLKTVDIVYTSGDIAIIKGLEDGTMLAKGDLAYAYEGMEIN